MSVKLVMVLLVVLWYALAAYHIYARHIDRPNNPTPDVRLAALAWMVSPIALGVALLSCLRLALDEVRSMATPPASNLTLPSTKKTNGDEA